METFANSSPATNILLNEPGLHWNCSINRDDRQCVIHCFGENGYAISFRINDVTKARGRATLEDELILSVVSWLEGNDLNEMHDNFEFIDPGKRTLEKFRDKSIEVYPELEQYATIKFEPALRESFCLKISSSNRHCNIHCYNDSKIPTCQFYWDDFYVFEFALDNMLDSALILKRWFCDNAMPSALAKEFPFLDNENLSEYFNFWKVIEADFLRSWDDVEHFYKEWSNMFNLDMVNISKLITQMRQKGFDRTLRAGSSLAALVLSRSRHHGLRVDQSSLIFEFHTGNLEIFTFQNARVNGRKKLHSLRIEFTPQIEKLLKELEGEDID